MTRQARFSASLGALWLLAAPVAGAAVEYELTYEAFWNGGHNQSGSLPPAAHFTDVIGMVHTANPFWSPGFLATSRMEVLAETGSTALLATTIQNRIAAGTASERIDFPTVLGFPATHSTTLMVEEAFPLVTLAAMVAPSPDWFIGISALDLAPGGVFLDEVVVDLRPYDAGTEDGDDFLLINPDTVPHVPISSINGTPFNGAPVIGRLTFRRVQAVPAVGLLPLFGGMATMLFVARSSLG